jgi:hypothetical protein
LVIAATNYSSTHEARHGPGSAGWTAVSRPPYFTAIGLWSTGDAWRGGGIWKGNRELLINSHFTWKPKLAAPDWISVREVDGDLGNDEPHFSLRLQEHGWKGVQEGIFELLNPDFRSKQRQAIEMLETDGLLDEMREDALQELFALFGEARPRHRTLQIGVMEKEFTGGKIEREFDLTTEWWRVRDAAGKERLAWEVGPFQQQLVDVDASERVVFGDGGCLWAWSSFPDGAPVKVADLNENKFTLMEAPDWAKEW